MSVLGDACIGLADYLELQLGFPFTPGYHDAGQPLRKKGGFVFAGGTSPRGRHEEASLFVRVFIPRPSRPRNPDKPMDATELYNLVDDLKAKLGAVQTAQFGLWYFNLGRTTVDHDVWAVEIEVSAVEATPFDFPA